MKEEREWCPEFRVNSGTGDKLTVQWVVDKDLG